MDNRHSNINLTDDIWKEIFSHISIDLRFMQVSKEWYNIYASLDKIWLPKLKEYFFDEDIETFTSDVERPYDKLIRLFNIRFAGLTEDEIRFHLLVIRGKSDLVASMFSDSTKEEQKRLLNAVDGFGHLPVHYALKNNYLGIFYRTFQTKHLFIPLVFNRGHKTIKFSPIEYLMKQTNNNENNLQNSLIIYAICRTFQSLKIRSTKTQAEIALIKTYDHQYSLTSIIKMAAHYNRLDFLEYLKQKDMLELKEINQILQVALNKKHNDIIIYLMNEYFQNKNVGSTNDISMILAASDMLDVIIDQDRSDLLSPLISFQQYGLVLSKYDAEGETLLNRAIKTKKFKVAIVLIQNNSAINQVIKDALVHFFTRAQKSNRGLREIVLSSQDDHAFSILNTHLTSLLAYAYMHTHTELIEFFTSTLNLRLSEDDATKIMKLVANNPRTVVALQQRLSSLSKKDVDALFNTALHEGALIQAECFFNLGAAIDLEDVLARGLPYEAVKYILAKGIIPQEQRSIFRDYINKHHFLLVAIRMSDEHVISQFCALGVNANLVKYDGTRAVKLLKKTQNMTVATKILLINSGMEVVNEKFFKNEISLALSSGDYRVINAVLDRKFVLTTNILFYMLAELNGTSTPVLKLARHMILRATAIPAGKAEKIMSDVIKKEFPKILKTIDKLVDCQKAYLQHLSKIKMNHKTSINSELDALRLMFHDYSKVSTYLFRHHHQLANEISCLLKTSNIADAPRIYERLKAVHDQLIRDKANPHGEMVVLLYFATGKLEQIINENVVGKNLARVYIDEPLEEKFHSVQTFFANANKNSPNLFRQHKDLTRVIHHLLKTHGVGNLDLIQSKLMAMKTLYKDSQADEMRIISHALDKVNAVIEFRDRSKAKRDDYLLYGKSLQIK